MNTEQEITKLKEKYKYLLKQFIDLDDHVDMLVQQNYELNKRCMETGFSANSKNCNLADRLVHWVRNN